MNLIQDPSASLRLCGKPFSPLPRLALVAKSFAHQHRIRILQAPHYLVFENLILICGTGGLALTVFAYFYFKRAYREKSEALKM